jgi:signal transduction histidine kinase
MGLWAVRHTAMALWGTIACETEMGKGATFIMRLPVVNTGASTTETRPTKSEESRR